MQHALRDLWLMEPKREFWERCQNSIHLKEQSRRSLGFCNLHTFSKRAPRETPCLLCVGDISKAFEALCFLRQRFCLFNLQNIWLTRVQGRHEEISKQVKALNTLYQALISALTNTNRPKEDISMCFLRSFFPCNAKVIKMKI